MLQKVVLVEIWRSHYLAGVAVLLFTVYNDSENEILAKLLKGALKFTENFQEVISNGFQQFRSSTILLEFLSFGYLYILTVNKT